MRVRNFGRIREVLPIPNLAEVQAKSYAEFLQFETLPEKRKAFGLEAILRESFPLKSHDETLRLEYVKYELGKPRYTEDICRELRLTYSRPFRVWCRLTGSAISDAIEEDVYVGELPIMIGGGEFIINGAERVIVSQLHRSPGVDFSMSLETGDRRLHSCRIIPERGSWIEMQVSKKDTLTIRIDQSSKISATTFLRAMSPDFAETPTIIRLFHETKTVDISRVKANLKPSDWYVVEDVVDKKTGEVLVEAGRQIGEQWDVLKNSALARGKPVGKEVVLEWMEGDGGLEFAWYECQKDLDGRELTILQDAVILTFPDEERDSPMPQFNGGLGGKGEIRPGTPKWSAREEEVRESLAEDKTLRGEFEACLAVIKSRKTEWFNVQDHGKAPAKSGVYFYRSKKSKDIGHGYIGEARGTEKGWGLKKRLGRHHDGSLNGKDKGYSDNLLKAVKRYLESRARGGIQRIEVVADPNCDPLIFNALLDDPTTNYDEALLRIYSRLRVGNPPNLQKARDLFHDKFFDSNRYRLGKVGRFRLNRKFEQNVAEKDLTLRPEDFVEAMRYILKLRGGEGDVDDIDDLGNRRLRTIGELLGDEIRKGFLKLRRTVQERMSIAEPDQVTPRTLINSKSVSSEINFFFARSELSQVVDTTNPLAQLTHERRLSALGPGGLNRKRAGFEVRDVHLSHYGRICPIQTPEGTNIGLITQLSVYATVDEYGFLITPYRKVEKGKVNDDIRYLRADEEMKVILAPADVPMDDKGRIVGESVLARSGGDFILVSPEEIDYVGVSPKQLVGISAGLIPFLEHDDANRALMGANMQGQSVPLIKPEPPIVATGLEHAIAENSGMVVRARQGGVVREVDSTRIVVEVTDGEEEYKLRKFVGLNEPICLNQKPIVNIGQRVKKGQIIADGASTKDGELALGSNLLVAFMPWDGFNFEDAILVSERVLKEDRLTSIHIDEFEVEVRETKLGREEFTRDIPNVGERALRNLGEDGVVRVGTPVGPGDILVGKVAPKSKTELSPEEKLLHAIFGRAGEDVKNDSLTAPGGVDGIVIEAKKFSRVAHLSDSERKRRQREAREFEKKINVDIVDAFRHLISELNAVLHTRLKEPGTGIEYGTGDPKHIVDQAIHFDFDAIETRSKFVDDAYRTFNREWPRVQEMLDERSRRIDQYRRGDELPSGVLEMVKVYIATKRTLSAGDKLSGRHGNKGVIAKILPEEDMPFLEDGTPIDILLNPLGVPGRMNIGQILETHLGWAAKVLGFQAVTPVFDGCKESEIRELLEEAGLPGDGKVTLYDGRTGERFYQKVTVGYIYVMKLHHLVDDKVHARATGPYSLITQQPLGGKARNGGQRFGEMEVWALEGYGASYILQEMLTVKSDDVEGRTKIYESMVMGRNKLEAGTPASFDVLCNEIKGLCLNMRKEKGRI